MSFYLMNSKEKPFQTQKLHENQKFLAIPLCLSMLCTISPVLAAADSAANNPAENSDFGVSQTSIENKNANSNPPTITI